MCNSICFNSCLRHVVFTKLFMYNRIFDETAVFARAERRQYSSSSLPWWNRAKRDLLCSLLKRSLILEQGMPNSTLFFWIERDVGLPVTHLCFVCQVNYLDWRLSMSSTYRKNWRSQMQSELNNCTAISIQKQHVLFDC